MTNKIHHPNVVKGIRVEPESFITELARFHPIDMPNLITEFCDGGDLRRQLNENRNASGMCESEVRHILDALKNAVFYLHSLLIIHRDIKPENIVIQMTVDGRKTYKVTFFMDKQTNRTGCNFFCFSINVYLANRSRVHKTNRFSYH